MWIEKLNKNWNPIKKILKILKKYDCWLKIRYKIGPKLIHNLWSKCVGLERNVDLWSCLYYSSESRKGRAHRLTRCPGERQICKIKKCIFWRGVQSVHFSRGKGQGSIEVKVKGDSKGELSAEVEDIVMLGSTEVNGESKGQKSAEVSGSCKGQE